ncbi:hypothetical protein PIB30_104831, partial [Stylosanthes scabra]|nr:hypothetical protein [Stylosanthes scabra]
MVFPAARPVMFFEAFAACGGEHEPLRDVFHRRRMQRLRFFLGSGIPGVPHKGLLNLDLNIAPPREYADSSQLQFQRLRLSNLLGIVETPRHHLPPQPTNSVIGNMHTVLFSKP